MYSRPPYLKDVTTKNAGEFKQNNSLYYQCIRLSKTPNLCEFFFHSLGLGNSINGTISRSRRLKRDYGSPSLLCFYFAMPSIKLACLVRVMQQLVQDV
jgi:hypothetical protein